MTEIIHDLRSLLGEKWRTIEVLKEKIISDKYSVQRRYKKHLGKIPNLDSPKLFTEKIQWLKLYYRNEQYPICADKFRVRQYVKDKIGESYLIPLLYVSKEPKDIISISLPDKYIIKTNHTSGYNLVVKNDKMKYFNKTKRYDKKRISKLLTKWLKINVYHLNKEWEYRDIPPLYLIEKLLNDESGNDILNDYKIHCFHGKPTFIQTIFDREVETKESWFDIEWNLLDMSYFSNKRKNVAKPANLDEMLKIASELSSDFIYVRVDLYSIKGITYFGELTFHPYSGVMSFSPNEWDKKLGDLINLPLHD